MRSPTWRGSSAPTFFGRASRPVRLIRRYGLDFRRAGGGGRAGAVAPAAAARGGGPRQKVGHGLMDEGRVGGGDGPLHFFAIGTLHSA